MYQKVLDLIKAEAEAMQTKIMLEPEYLFKKDNKFKKNKLCLEISNRVNRKLQEPWVTKEELGSLYNMQIETGRTSCKNVFYIAGDVRVYSSINHEKFYMDEDYNMYIDMKLCHQGNITDYYNPYVTVKLNLLAPLTMLKLTNNQKFSFDLKAYLKRKGNDDEKSISRVNLY